MRYAIALIAAAACFGQGKQNVAQTGIVDAHGANWRFPESTFTGLPTPAGGNTGWRYTVTDCLTSACTAGGGSVQADLRSTGSAWVVISGGGGSAAPPCQYGTVSYTALTAAMASQEVTIQTGVLGTYRYHGVVLSET